MTIADYDLLDDLADLDGVSVSAVVRRLIDESRGVLRAKLALVARAGTGVGAVAGVGDAGGTHAHAKAA